jgi:photosystem II stability/assembly factor-like uncharacterized protein
MYFQNKILEISFLILIVYLKSFSPNNYAFGEQKNVIPNSSSQKFLKINSITNKIDYRKWVNIGPGGGGWFRCVEFSPYEKKLYIGGDVSGIFISSDYVNFKPCNTDLKNLYINAIYLHPTNKKIIYLGTRGGVAKSIDGGETWEMLRDGFKPLRTFGHSASVYAMAIDSKNPDIIYACLGQERNFGGKGSADDISGYLYKSENGGKNWKEIFINKSIQNESFMSIVIDPSDHNVLYLLSQTKLFTSMDKGSSWHELPDLPVKDCVYTYLSIKRDNPNIILASYRKDAKTGIIKTSDKCKTWTETTLKFNQTRGGGINRIKNHPKNNNVFFANYDLGTKEEGGVYITKDSGDTWQKINKSKIIDKRLWSGWDERSTDFAIDPKNPEIMAYVNDMEVYITYDGGKVWTAISSQRVPGANEKISDLWKNSGLDILCPKSMVVNPMNPNIIYLGYMDVGLFKTEDGGNTLSRITSGLTDSFACCNLINIDPGNPEIIYIAYGMNRNKQSIFKSINGGKNFERVGSENSGFNDKGYISNITIDPTSEHDKRIIYASVVQIYKEDKSKFSRGIFKSVDNGNSWKSINKGLPNNSLAICDISLHPANSQILFICSQNDYISDSKQGGYIAKSVNGGESWEVILSLKLDLRCIAIDPFDPNIIYAGNRDYSGFQLNRIFLKSLDGGKSWNYIKGDIFNKGIVSFKGDKGNRYYPTSIVPDPAIRGRLYITFSDHGSEYNNRGGIFFSNDYGETWEPFDMRELPNLSINKIYIDPVNRGRLYILTGGNGIWRYDIPSNIRKN